MGWISLTGLSQLLNSAPLVIFVSFIKLSESYICQKSRVEASVELFQLIMLTLLCSYSCSYHVVLTPQHTTTNGSLHGFSLFF